VNIRDNQNFWKWIAATEGEFDMPVVQACQPLPVERIVPIVLRGVKPTEMAATCFYVEMIITFVDHFQN